MGFFIQMQNSIPKRDQNSGIQEYGFRYYDPVTGRFITREGAPDAGNLGNPYTSPGSEPSSYPDLSWPAAPRQPAYTPLVRYYKVPDIPSNSQLWEAPVYPHRSR